MGSGVWPYENHTDLPQLAALQLHFTDDAFEEPVELYHKLKLYGEDDPSGQAISKKPVSGKCNMLTIVLLAINQSAIHVRKFLRTARQVTLPYARSFPGSICLSALVNGSAPSLVYSHAATVHACGRLFQKHMRSWFSTSQLRASISEWQTTCLYRHPQCHKHNGLQLSTSKTICASLPPPGSVWLA